MGNWIWSGSQAPWASENEWASKQVAIIDEVEKVLDESGLAPPRIGWEKWSDFVDGEDECYLDKRTLGKVKGARKAVEVLTKKDKCRTKGKVAAGMEERKRELRLALRRLAEDKKNLRLGRLMMCMILTGNTKDESVQRMVELFRKKNCSHSRKWHQWGRDK